MRYPLLMGKIVKTIPDIWSNISLQGAKFNFTSGVSYFHSIRFFEQVLINSQKKLKVSFDEIFRASDFEKNSTMTESAA